MNTRRHPIPHRADTSDAHEAAAILGTDYRGALAILSDAGIEPAFRDGGKPHYFTRDVRAVADGRPVVRGPLRRSRAMY